jgi:cytochrome c
MVLDETRGVNGLMALVLTHACAFEVEQPHSTSEGCTEQSDAPLRHGHERNDMQPSFGASLGKMAIVAAIAALSSQPLSAKERAPSGAVLVYTKAAGFVHKSIPVGAEAIRELGRAHGFAVEVTADPAAFEPANLAKYKAVVFLSTTGNVLPADSQRAAFEGYIRNGGGFLGIHAASDMGPVATSWPFYLNLVGAAFKGHTNARLYSDRPMPSRAGVTYGGPLSAAPSDAEQVTPDMKVSSSEPARIVVEDRASPLTRGWGRSVTRTDEWYGFRTNPRPHVHVIASLDETTFTPGAGAMDGDHPIAWCRSYEGGRSVYTGLGHPIPVWSDPAFLRHILGGIRLAMGSVPFKC